MSRTAKEIEMEYISYYKVILTMYNMVQKYQKKHTYAGRARIKKELPKIKYV